MTQTGKFLRKLSKALFILLGVAAIPGLVMVPWLMENKPVWFRAWLAYWETPALQSPGHGLPITGPSGSTYAVGQTLRDRLPDGAWGPEMVVLPASDFIREWIGDPSRRLAIEQPFAIARYETTFAEYDRFAEATGRPQPEDQGWGRGRRPVIHVSFADALAYTEWLSAQTGATYRLPTEQEWEYAARAGAETAFAFGSTISTHQANFKGAEWRRQTAPVGQYPPNGWGLHDLHGNVWEWTTSESESTVRGGSWRWTDRSLEFASRLQSGRTDDWPGDDIGFRVVRTLW